MLRNRKECALCTHTYVFTGDMNKNIPDKNIKKTKKIHIHNIRDTDKTIDENNSKRK